MRRQIGYVIQQIGLFPNMTVEENISVVPRLLGWDKTKAKRRAAELLEIVALDPSIYLSRYPKDLSGGQQQRVGVARALATDPPVMLMDEPFGAIDPINRELIEDEFLRIQQQVKKTIMFVSHDIDEAVKMADRIAIFRAGRPRTVRYAGHDSREARESVRRRLRRRGPGIEAAAPRACKRRFVRLRVRRAGRRQQRASAGRCSSGTASSRSSC